MLHLYMHLCKDNTSKKLFLQNIKVSWFLTFHEKSNAIKTYFMLIFILFFIMHNISSSLHLLHIRKYL